MHTKLLAGSISSIFALLLSLCAIIVISSCTGPPEVTEATLTPNPNEHVPLAGILSFVADRPVTATLLIDDGENQRTINPKNEAAKNVEIPVLGLHADKHYTVTVTVKDEDGKESVISPMTLDTPPLPDDFPDLKLTARNEGSLEPGVTMLNVFRWTGPFTDDSHWGLLVALDENGEVVWYFKSDFGVGEGRRMQNGNLFFGGHEDGRMYEIDMLGNIVQEWHSSGATTEEVPDNSIAVNTDTFHHDVIQTKSGNFIGLGLEVRRDEDFPLEYPPGTRRGPANLACDVVLEFTPEGETVHEYHLADILDTERLGEGSLQQGFYSTLYKDRFDSLEMPYDITHANALYYLEEEDALIVSMNVQCAIFKIDMATGELKWILGDATGWNEDLSTKLLTPIGDLTWPCHQHGLEMTPNGTLLLFDNGGSRRIPPQKPMAPADQFSRAIEYRIDEEAGTVEEVWVYGPAQESFVSPFISDADYLMETGNVLITDGGRFMDKDGNPMNTFGGHQWARVLEVTHDENPQKLWEVTLKDPKTRYSIYRAQRLKSLYPKLDRPTG